jgi:hypothetical protein
MLQGRDFRRWHLDATNDLRNPTMAAPIDPDRRRDKFHLRNRKKKWSRDNAKEVARWLWVWLK